MEKISYTNCVTNEEVLHTVKDTNNLNTIKKKKRKANWIGHILHRKCLLKHVTEQRIKGDNEKRSSKE